jgi:hypothetical protein
VFQNSPMFEFRSRQRLLCLQCESERLGLSRTPIGIVSRSSSARHRASIIRMSLSGSVSLRAFPASSTQALYCFVPSCATTHLHRRNGPKRIHAAFLLPQIQRFSTTEPPRYQRIGNGCRRTRANPVRKEGRNAVQDFPHADDTRLQVVFSRRFGARPDMGLFRTTRHVNACAQGRCATGLRDDSVEVFSTIAERFAGIANLSGYNFGWLCTTPAMPLWLM